VRLEARLRVGSDAYITLRGTALEKIDILYGSGTLRSRSLSFYLKHLDDLFKGFKAGEIRGSDVLEYIAKRQEEGAANSSINRELSA
jgi:hypothetical protein